jgi:hypothetical protein
MVTEWTAIPLPEDEDEYTAGTIVHLDERYTGGPRWGVVAGWAVGNGVLPLYLRTKDPAYLIDSEGPLVRWDDQDPADETLDWYPGQAMFLLGRLS